MGRWLMWVAPSVIKVVSSRMPEDWVAEVVAVQDVPGAVVGEGS